MQGGLRERKKLAVRRALSSAAIRLAVERGVENVTIEEITAEADVSVRTFGNYFSSKYEALCALGTDRARRIGAELLARPAREPLWEALVNAMLAHYEGADQAPDPEWLASLKLVLTAPAIRSEYLRISSAMQEVLAEAIAAKTGMDVEQDMYPQVLAGAVTAAAQVAVRRWATADRPVPLRPLLRSALDQLATACSGGADRYLTEEEFQALVRPAIFGPNGPLCEPPGKPVQLAEAALLVTPPALPPAEYQRTPGVQVVAVPVEGDLQGGMHEVQRHRAGISSRRQTGGFAPYRLTLTPLSTGTSSVAATQWTPRPHTEPDRPPGSRQWAIARPAAATARAK